jgi:hypothetical protein
VPPASLSHLDWPDSPQTINNKTYRDDNYDRRDGRAKFATEHAETKKYVRDLLDGMFGNFGESNCGSVFAEKGIDIDALKEHAYAMNFVNGTGDWGDVFSQNSFAGNGNSTSLNDSLNVDTDHGSFRAKAVTLRDGDGNLSNTVILNIEDLGASSVSTRMQQSTVLHEVLHSFMNAGDSQLFARFGDSGLTDNYQNGRTQSISDWIYGDCKETPEAGSVF